jgi:hypothetical protein
MESLQWPTRRRPVRLGLSIAAVVLGLTSLAACGGGDGGDGEAVVTAGPGTAGPFGGPGGETADPPPDTSPGGGEPVATTAEAPPPTAGGGEAGIRTDPGGNQIIVLPECGSIDVTAHLEQGAYTELRARLSCVFENEAVAPLDVVAAARAADAIAAARIAEQDPDVVLDDDVQEVLDEPPPDLPPAFEDMIDEAQEIAEDVSADQEGG